MLFFGLKYNPSNLKMLWCFINQIEYMLRLKKEKEDETQGMHLLVDMYIPTKPAHITNH